MFRRFPVAMVSTDRITDRIQHIDTDVDDYVGGQVSGPPFRPAIYQMSMNGMHDWQSWADLQYPPDYRLLLTKGSIADTAQISVVNNPPNPMSYAPIAIQDYSIPTQMVYTGTGEI